MKNKRILLLSLFVFVLTIMVGCTPRDEGLLDDVEMSNELDVIFSGEAAQRTMTYNQETPLVLPDGTSVISGELKPTWKYVQSIMEFTINDKTDASKKTKDMWAVESTAQFKNADVYGGPNLGPSIMDAGANDNLFVALSDYMDYLPDFKAFLDANPTIKKIVTASDGKIYHIPYVAEIGNYARTLCGRQSWVEILLDGTKNGETFAIEDGDTTKTIDVSYTGYWDRNDKNVINLQNEKAVNGKLSQKDALDVLKDYISETYPNLTKLSQLYCGDQACYDIDELVALWRVIKMSPLTLTKEAYGSAKTDAVIYPYYVRQETYREDYLRLITYFGGTRVYGSDSYAERFYTDKEGELHYSYYEDDFLAGLDRLKKIASEGLVDPAIYSGDGTSKTNLRSKYIFADKVETTKQYGFMTFDWISSTTALGKGDGEQDDVCAMLPPLTTTPESNGKFVHFLENTRVVKPDGWGISANATPERIKAALKMFNYFFTEEGAIVQNYGPDFCRTGNKYTRPNGVATDYPEFTSWVKENATTFKNGNISDFLRDYVGSLMPIGYQKSIGFELQAYSTNGWKSVDLLDKANVLSVSYTASSPYYTIVAKPSINKSEATIVSGLAFTSSGDGISQKLFDYILGGEGAPENVSDIKSYYEGLDIETYIEVYRSAFERLK